jgi:hypothetical protein
VELLERARKGIAQTRELYGEGPEWDAWRPRYEALMKDIQQELGETPVGFE